MSTPLFTAARMGSIILVFSMLFLFPVFSFAQTEFVPLAPIPGLTDTVETDNLATFFNALYMFAIGAAVVLAIVQLIRAGIMYMGGDSVTKTEQARSIIRDTIFGLLLVLAPALVFGIINPDILNLRLDTSALNIDQTQDEEGGTGGARSGGGGSAGGGAADASGDPAGAGATSTGSYYVRGYTIVGIVDESGTPIGDCLEEVKGSTPYADKASCDTALSARAHSVKEICALSGDDISHLIGSGEHVCTPEEEAAAEEKEGFYVTSWWDWMGDQPLSDNYGKKELKQTGQNCWKYKQGLAYPMSEVSSSGKTVPTLEICQEDLQAHIREEQRKASDYPGYEKDTLDYRCEQSVTKNVAPRLFQAPVCPS